MLKVRYMAAGIKTIVPTAIISNPNIIPRLNPVFSRILEDGNAINV